MSLADEIRNTFALPNEYFEKYIIPRLKENGRVSIICDTHIGEIKNYCIPSKYQNSLEQWGRENGFKVGFHCNSYGVRHIDITI